MSSIASNDSRIAPLTPTLAGWSGLPPEYAIPERAPSLTEAQEYCRRLARSHYENFSVASWFLPERLRQHFFNIYSYCRISDDLGDEVGDPEASLQLLDAWQEELDACYDASPRHPVFVALTETVRKFDIPKQPFNDLLTAFRQDQNVQRYETFEALLGYCHYSANPVGHLVLYLCGYRDAERQALSDATCTALQLANFWQDVSRDLDIGRIYIPLDRAAAHGLTEQEIVERKFDKRYVALMRELIVRTRELFAEGRPLAKMVEGKLSVDLEMFSRGGIAVLDAIERQGYDTLHERPSVSKGKQARMLGRALLSQVRVRKAKVTPI